MNKWFLLLMCLFYSLQGAEEIQVQLPTASVLEPAYLGPLEGKSAAFDAQYLRKIEAVLQFDLAHNGALMLLPQKEGAIHVLSWALEGSSLALTLLSTGATHLKTFTEIPLSGSLTHDRTQIHKLADSIYKALFQKEGIAQTKILFAYRTKPEWASEIWECDYDGGNARQVTHEGSYCVTPVAIPDRAHDHFLYVSYKIGQPKIFVGNRKGGAAKRLVDLRGNQLLPAISLQKDKVAFICDASGRTDLFLQAFDPKTGVGGKPVQLYSYPRSTQASPTFSPDGSQIAFVSDKDGGMRIFLIPTRQTEKRPQAVLLTKQNRENSCPAWSPDGTKLAYSAKTNGVRQIWIYDFATREEWQLTSGPGHKENPAWAPNSQHLVFNSSDGAHSELYFVNLNQPEAVRLNVRPGQKHYPSWEL